MDDLVIFTDGASRGNPGNAACGFLVKGETKYPVTFFLGRQTNNYAEYSAVIKALEYVLEKGITNANITLVSDSSLVVNQINSNFKVKSKNIKGLYLKLLGVVSQLKKRGVNLEFKNMPRETPEIMAVDRALNRLLDEIEASGAEQ